jgi:hypothetical protein
MRRPIRPHLFALVAALVLAPAAAAAPGDPVANFNYTPSAPLSGEVTTFSASSTGDRPLVRHEWDLDGDGAYDDAVGPTATWAFAAPGIQTVRLRSIDDIGAYGVVTRYVAVGNRPPQASWTVFPNPPAAGQPTSFVSTSTDPDTAIRSYEWDLDGDGQFDDASGPTATRTYFAQGLYTLRLRVTDVLGATGTRTVRMAVGRAQLMNPFPTVRIVGRLTRRGLRVSRLEVNAPVGASILATCRGRGCTRKRLEVDVPSPSKKSRVTPARRFRSFERSLRAGAVITVRVSKDGVIGKYTHYRVRRGRLPIRRDLCIEPGRSRPVTCPR